MNAFTSAHSIIDSFSVVVYLLFTLTPSLSSSPPTPIMNLLSWAPSMGNLKFHKIFLAQLLDLSSFFFFLILCCSSPAFCVSSKPQTQQIWSCRQYGTDNIQIIALHWRRAVIHDESRQMGAQTTKSLFSLIHFIFRVFDFYVLDFIDKANLICLM